MVSATSIVSDDSIAGEGKANDGEHWNAAWDPQRHSLIGPLAAHGLTWAELTAWWSDREGMTDADPRDVSRSLYRRLERCLGDNDAERRVLRAYAEHIV
jgi:hypothetical protein